MNNKYELKSLLLNYTIWLDKRGAFCEDLCIDWEHQIETFLTQFSQPPTTELNGSSDIIEKACYWLNDHAKEYVGASYGPTTSDTYNLVYEFRKAMEGE